MMTAGTAARSADAHLLDEDIKSGQLQLNLGLARVASAASEAVSARAAHGVHVAGGRTAHSGGNSQAAEQTVSGFDTQCAMAEALGGAGSGGGGDGSGGSGSFAGAGPGSGIGRHAFPILPNG